MFVQPANYHTAELFCMVAGVLLLKTHNYASVSESVTGNYHANMSTNLFRFRDFEPRYSKASSPSGLDGGGAGRSRASNASERNARGFLFHAEGNDVIVDMEFIVPFVKIPVERSMDLARTTFRNLVNLNKGSLLATGAFVGVGAAIVGIIRALSSSGLYSDAYKKTGRGADAGNTFDWLAAHAPQPLTQSGAAVGKMDDIVGALEAKLQEHDIDMAVCVQKYICSYVQTAAWDMRLGKADSLTKIVDGVANLDLLGSYLNGTALQEAIETGKQANSHQCDQVYRRCKWPYSENKWLKLALNYLKYFNS